MTILIKSTSQLYIIEKETSNNRNNNDILVKSIQNLASSSSNKNNNDLNENLEKLIERRKFFLIEILISLFKSNIFT